MLKVFLKEYMEIVRGNIRMKAITPEEKIKNKQRWKELGIALVIWPPILYIMTAILGPIKFTLVEYVKDFFGAYLFLGIVTAFGYMFGIFCPDVYKLAYRSLFDKK